MPTNLWLELPGSTWRPPVLNATLLPSSGNQIGDAIITQDTDTIYVWNGTSWIPVATPGAAIAIDGLTGDVSATGPGVVHATVNFVGGESASDVAAATVLALTATSFNNPSTIVRRDSSGDFSAHAITLSGTITASNFTGSSSGTNTGDVTLGTPNGLSLSAQVLSLGLASASTTGALSSSDWSTFNNKLSPSQFNYITNSDAETNTVGWNLYNNAGRTAPAYLVNQDLTFTSALSGNAGNGVEIEYIYNASFPASTPNINVISPSHVQVQWNNGPTIANNPTATQLQTAWNAVPAALAIATVAITGSPSKLQYITGAKFLGNGGDASPTNGTGGVPSGVTFTRNTSTPLVGTASFDLGKSAVNAQGQGVSTDFVIDSADKGKPLQIDFLYEGSSGMVLGANSDVQVFIYDINNAALLPVTPLETIPGPVNTIKTFTGLFTATTSSDYRLILHIATTNAAAWDLLLDSVFVTDELSPVTATQVPSVVLLAQPISGAVTDHMVVMWRDGATQWVPATIAGACIPAFGTDQTQLGFATGIVGSTAQIYISGAMDGFSFGPFTGFDQYIDNTAGGISPLPSPFTDLYCIVGMAISSTVLNIQFKTHVDLISNASGTPLKGGLLSSSAVNDGTGDVVLTVGSNGNSLIANSATATGLQWAPAIVNGGGFAYTVATRTLVGTLTGDVTGTLTATTIAATTVTGKALTGFVSGAGTVTAADTILTAFNKINGNVALKAPLASPVFTGDVNASTGNVLVSTIGKGLQVKTGTNAKIGTAVLVAGTVTVANTSVTANSRIFLTSNTDGGTPGWLRVSAKTNATSFVITSSSATDTSTVAWIIVESIP